MAQETIDAGQWIFTEGGQYGYFMYKLIKGKVSVYSGGAKVNEITVNEGDAPVSLGIIAALREDGKHTASVKSETEIVVERVFLDQIRGVLRNEIPDEMKSDIDTMLNTILINNEINSLKARLAKLPKVSLEIPENLQSNSVLQEIVRLYSFYGDKS